MGCRKYELKEAAKSWVVNSLSEIKKVLDAPKLDIVEHSSEKIGQKRVTKSYPKLIAAGTMS